MSFDFPINERQEQEAREEIENAKERIGINDLLVEIIVRRHVQCGIHDQRRLQDIKASALDFVLNDVNPLIQDIVISESLAQNKDTFYQKPKRRRGLRYFSFFVEIHDPRCEELLAAIIGSIYAHNNSELMRHKLVCLKNAIEYIGDLEFGRFV